MHRGNVRLRIYLGAQRRQRPEAGEGVAQPEGRHRINRLCAGERLGPLPNRRLDAAGLVANRFAGEAEEGGVPVVDGHPSQMAYGGLDVAPGQSTATDEQIGRPRLQFSAVKPPRHDSQDQELRPEGKGTRILAPLVHNLVDVAACIRSRQPARPGREGAVRVVAS